ncbi:MAG: LPS-assembly protein LptD [Proteobacteria bacterium]|nr:LPS-assembly protein LptD [Pseudomonadota bacterium]
MQLLPARAPALLAACFASWCAALPGAPLAQGLQLAQGLRPPQAEAPKEKGPTYIDAERIEGVMDVEITATGKAELRQDETAIFGERIKLNQEYNRIDADGGVRLQQGSDRFYGTRLKFNSANDTGVIDDATFSIRGGDKPSRGKAEKIEFLGKNHYTFRNGSFTTCDPGRDDWVVEGKEIELDYDAQVGTVRNGKLRFLDTSIAVLPWMDFTLEKGRKTGFLSPGYVQSTRSGLELSTPFYWNISPEEDATITPRYLSKRGLQLQSEYRYLDPKYSGLASFEYLPNDNAFGRNRWGMSLYHQQVFTPNLFGRLDLNGVSDGRYFVDLFSKVRQTSQATIQREQFLQYNGANFWVQQRIQRFQTLQDPLAPIVAPYNRALQLNAATWKNQIGDIADFALPLEYVRFSHSTLVEGTRISANPTITAPYLTPGFFVTPKIGLRYASYGLDQVAVGQPTRQSVAVPWLSLDSGLIFERPTQIGKRDFTQTLEPRLYYVRAPYRNQDNIPIFDTGLADFNFASIFSENRFAGGDRFGDANQLTVAATSRLLFPSGQEFLRASIGQRFSFRDQRVNILPGAPPQTSGSSDLLASVGARMGRDWNFDTTIQYNIRDRVNDRAGANLRYAPEFAKFVNLGYRYNRDSANPINQIDLSGQWPIKPGWFVLGRYNYSIFDGRLLEGVAGLEYNAGCWVVRFIGHRTQVATQVAATEFFVQLELNDLAQIGSDPFDMLRRAIPGYTATNIRSDQPMPASLQRRLPFDQVF